MIKSSKFNIGQKVRHKLLGFLGIIIDIDIKYSLSKKKNKNLNNIKKFNKYPWYHVIIQDNNGYPIYLYLSELQLIWNYKKKYINYSILNKLSKKIKNNLKLKN